MRGSRPGLLVLLLSTASCGATLTRGPGGWHQSGLSYSVAPLPNGDFVPAGWTLKDYSPRKDGFRHDATTSTAPEPDFDFRRTEDDGALLIRTESLPEEDRAKHAEVLADRWIDQIVRHPKDDDEDVELFARVVPKLETTAHGSVGWRPTSATILSGYDVTVERREAFAVVGGEGAETVITLGSHGGPPERTLYVAVAKAPDAGEFVVLVYGNAISMFEKGAADATSFAHRVHF